MWPFKQSAYFTLGHSLFWAVRLSKNVDFNDYKYPGYRTEFDVDETFLLSNGSGFGKNVIIFGVDMNSSTHIGNKKNISWFFLKFQRKN